MKRFSGKILRLKASFDFHVVADIGVGHSRRVGECRHMTVKIQAVAAVPVAVMNLMDIIEIHCPVIDTDPVNGIQSEYGNGRFFQSGDFDLYPAIDIARPPGAMFGAVIRMLNGKPGIIPGGAVKCFGSGGCFHNKRIEIIVI